MHQIAFGDRVPPRPAGGAYSAPPDSIAGWIKGNLLLREGMGREGRGREKKGGEKKGGRGEKGGRGLERE